MKLFKKGFIVGKFCPLHKGHQFLIETGLSMCQELMILSYTSTNYINCEPTKRYRWITTLYPETKVIVLNPDECPFDSHPVDIHRAFCASKMLINNFIPDVIFSSEEYGEPFSKFISNMFKKEVKHYLVDIKRLAFPISGTKMRDDFNPEFCSDVVRKDFEYEEDCYSWW
jgi:HTH-type transcriptional repressor of NAD biosynthesis genes